MVLPGFNTEVRYKGVVYHIQTEDNGVANPQVITLLYLKGAIVGSKKVSYRPLLEKGSYQAELMELMKSQHKSIIKDLFAGTFDAGGDEHRPAPAAAPPGSADASQPSSLDEAVIAYLDSCVEAASTSSRGGPSGGPG